MRATGRVTSCAQETPYRWLLRLDDVEAGLLICTLTEANRSARSITLPAVGEVVTLHLGYPSKGGRIIFPILAIEGAAR